MQSLSTTSSSYSSRESAFQPRVKRRSRSPDTSSERRKIKGGQALQEAFNRISSPKEPRLKPRRQSSVEIHDQIHQARDTQELFNTFQASGPHFEKEHYTKMLTQLSRKKIKHQEKNSVRRIVENAQNHIPDFTAQQAASTANSVAKLKLQDSTFLERIEEGFLSKKWNLSSLQNHNLTLLTNALSKQGTGTTKFFTQVEDEVRYRKVKNFDASDVSLLALAFAKAGEGSKRLFELFEDEVYYRLNDFERQSLCNIAWAFAKRGNFDRQTFEDLIGQVEKQQDRLSELDLNQLAQVQIHLKGEASELNLLQTGAFAEKLQARRLSQTDEQSTITELHENVFSIVQILYPNLTREESFEKNIEGLLVDIVIPHLRIAIEVNGPNHYKAASDELNGKSAAKLRLLEKLDYKTIEIPYFVWDKLDADEKKQFLEQLISFAQT